MIQACVFCLSQDRDLLIIDESLYLTLYPSFKEENIEYINYLQAENLLKVCWECHGRVTNFKTFIQTVDRSLNNLKIFMAFPSGDLPKSESKLQITTVDSIDIAPSIPPLLPPKAEQNVCNADNTIQSREQELNENGVSVTIVKLEITPDIDNFNRDDNDDSDMETSPEKSETQGSVLHSFSNNNVNLSAIKSECSKLNNATTSKNHNDDDSGEDDKPLAVWVSPLPTVTTKPAGKKELYPRRAASTNKLTGTPGSSKFSKVWVSNDQATRWHREELRRGREARLSCVHECDACERLFAEEEELNTHVHDAHSEEAGQYTCDVCLYRFLDQTKLKQHMEAHYINYKCKTCSFESRILAEMQKHVSDTHPNTKCLNCRNKFASKAELDRHYNLCETYKCSYCKAKFPFREMYMEHTQKHLSNPDGIYCEVCDMFCSPSRYKEHLRTSLKHVSRDSFKHECEICHNKYATARKLAHHMVSIHKRPGPHPCDLCQSQKSFFTKAQLLRHRAAVHNTGPGKVKKKREMDKMCETCGKGFRSGVALSSHRNTHTGERPWRCPDCPAAFTSAESLRLHRVRVHGMPVNSRGQEKKPNKFSCDVCGKQFPNPSRLKHHYEFCHLKKANTYQCKICDKIFRKAARLQKHARVHARRPCEPCGMWFKDAEALAKHLKKHSLPSWKGPYKCRSCGGSYKNMPEHYKLKHLHLKKGDRVTIKNLYNLDKEVEVIWMDKNASGGPEPRASAPRTRAAPRARLPCEICGRWFKDPDALDKHLNKHALPSSKGPDKCRSCDGSYSNVYEHYKLKHLHLKKGDRVMIKNLFNLDKEVEVIWMDKK